MLMHHRLIGIGHQPFKLEIAGSSPVGVTAPSSNVRIQDSHSCDAGSTPVGVINPDKNPD